MSQRLVGRFFFWSLFTFVLLFRQALADPMQATIKGLHTDFFDPNQVAGNGTGWVSVPIDWKILVGGDNGASLHDQFIASADACHSRSIDANGSPSTNPNDQNIFFSSGYVQPETQQAVNECIFMHMYDGINHVEFPDTLAKIDQMIDTYSSKGVRIIAIVTENPWFARIPQGDASTPGTCLYSEEGANERTVSCAPTVVPAGSSANDQDTRVAGITRLKALMRFLSQRYKGKVAAWVIENEVNTVAYFGTGCLDCESSEGAWIQTYASVFNAAYDGIVDGFNAGTSMPGVPMPSVMIPLTGQFDRPWDTAVTNGKVRQISAKTFLAGRDAKPGFAAITGFASLVGSRNWKLAQHAYPRDMFQNPYFDANDLTDGRRSSTEYFADVFSASGNYGGSPGIITHGTIGAVAGFLRATFPSDKWAFAMTEGGIWGSDQNAQWQALCSMFSNYVGTPGLDAMLYYRALDQTAPLEYFGLITTAGVGKIAWTTYSLSNRYLGSPSGPACGFENLPYTKMKRANSAGYGHRISSRTLPPGWGQAANVEATWYLMRDSRPETQPVYECWLAVTGHSGRTFASLNASCERGGLNLGPMGYTYTSAPADAVPGSWQQIYNCTNGSDDVVTGAANCENLTLTANLGWARTTTSDLDGSVYSHLFVSKYNGWPAHWASPIAPPPGFLLTGDAFWILREPVAGSKLYYECFDTNSNFPSEQEDCEGATKLGVLGYVAQSGTTPLYRCGGFSDSVSGLYDHWVSTSCALSGYHSISATQMGFISDDPANPGHHP